MRKRGVEGGKEGEKHQCEKENIDWLPFVGALTRDQSRNPGMCSDTELNLWPFSLEDNAQTTERPQPGHNFYFTK